MSAAAPPKALQQEAPNREEAHARPRRQQPDRPGQATGGLDLPIRHTEVQRLARKHPLFRVAVSRGHDPDDLLQAVVLGLLTRQQGRSRYDPSRANTPSRAWSKYIHVVAGSVLANVLDSARRLGRHEQVGMWVGDGQDDAARAQVAAPQEPEVTRDEVLLELTLRALPPEVAAVARDVLAGMTATEVCEAHGISRPGLARVVLRVQAMARAVRGGPCEAEQGEGVPVPMGEQLGLWGPVEGQGGGV